MLRFWPIKNPEKLKDVKYSGNLTWQGQGSLKDERYPGDHILYYNVYLMGSQYRNFFRSPFWGTELCGDY